jgi:hypothetical protein
MGSLADNRRAEIDREFELYKTAEREREEHLIKLWDLLDPEIKKALSNAAWEEGVHRDLWLKRRGLDFADARQQVFFAVLEAARRYDPEHSSGASFATYAFKYIKGEVTRLARRSPHLADKDDAERLERKPCEEHDPLRSIVELARTWSVSDIVESTYEETKDASERPSRKLRETAEWFREKYVDESEHDVKFQALHSMLIAQSIRAEDREGKLVLVSTLAKLLQIREARRAAGMPRESYSPAVLARVFSHTPTDKTLAKWLEACDEQGITAENWTPERLARIITPKRGPAFRGRINS